MNDFLGNKFKGIILSALYRNPTKKRIQHDIMDPLEVRLFPVQLLSYRKQLVMEGLITDDGSNEVDALIEITPKGYEAIQQYGGYMEYREAQLKEKENKLAYQELERKYLRYKIRSILVAIVLSIASFITGILLSNQVRELWQ
jgi:hypothetical protein